MVGQGVRIDGERVVEKVGRSDRQNNSDSLPA